MIITPALIQIINNKPEFKSKLPPESLTHTFLSNISPYKRVAKHQHCVKKTRKVPLNTINQFHCVKTKGINACLLGKWCNLLHPQLIVPLLYLTRDHQRAFTFRTHETSFSKHGLCILMCVCVWLFAWQSEKCVCVI